MSAYGVLTQLQADPRDYLMNNLINIAGGNTYGSTHCILGPGHNRTDFKVEYKHAIPGHGASIVWNVPMIGKEQAVQYDNLPHTHVTSTNPGLILTGMLTGCTVAVTVISPTELRICHVQPGGVRDGADKVEDDMRAQARMSDTAPTIFFGPQTYYTSKCVAHFIGLAVNGNWQLYGQMTSLGQGGYAVQGVKRLL